MSSRKTPDEAKPRGQLSRDTQPQRSPTTGSRSQSVRREEPDPASRGEQAATAPTASRGELPQATARRAEAAARTRRREQPAGRTSRELQPAPSAASPPVPGPQRSPQRRGVPASPDEPRAAATEVPSEPPSAAARHTPGAADRAPSSEQASGETDSFDEEGELLRCQADLVEAAAEMGTTSADEEPNTTDGDFDDDEDGYNLSVLPTIRLLRPWQRPSMASVVIEEDEEDILSSGLETDGCRYEVDSSEIRSRLWAQSLLRLKRSIDEIYSLCEFESDEGLCEQVQGILETASKDFRLLMQQLDAQQEYALLAGDYPFKSGVAWTSRTPRAAKVGESVLEQLERAQLSSPSHSSAAGRSKQLQKAGSAKRRSSSFDPGGGGATLDDPLEADDGAGDWTGGDNVSSEVDSGRPRSIRSAPGDQLQLMVQSALQRVQSRLEQAPNRPSPEELQRRQEERQRRAQQLRASQDDQKLVQVRQVESRLLAARERREERAQQRQRELLERMTRARRQYQDQLRLICQRARKENRKTAEVSFITKEALKSEKEVLKKKQEHAHISRALAREKMRKKLLESANRVAKVSENRRRQWEAWQLKVQQELEEKERLAEQRRREHIHSIRLKSQGHESRSEMVRGKRRELQEEDERSSQDFLRFSSKHIGRMALNCDGLPDGVREEVVEQLHQAPSGARRSTTGSASSSQHKTRHTARCATPPPTTASPSPKTASPAKGAAAGEAASAEWQALTRSLPAFPISSEVELLETPPLSSQQGEAGHQASSGSRGAKALAALVRPASAAALRHRMAAFPGGSGGSDLSDEELICEVAPSPSLSPEEAEAQARCAERLRGQVVGEALQDEEALRLACEAEGGKAAASSSAIHKAKISKLATDLGKVLSSGTTGEDAGSAPQPASASVNLERADSLLGEFCKLVAQFQKEADYALVLKLGCMRTVLEICSRIKDTIGMLSASTERSLPPAWRQTSNALLGALKWLGLMSKQPLVRMFLLLTNRVLPLADLALTCLEAHFCAPSPLPEAQSVAVLFLPQVLHVLSLHTRQSLPETASGLKQNLVSYLLLCGLSERLTNLLRQAEARGMRLFDGASAVPLLLLRATAFVGSLVGEYHPDPSSGDDQMPAAVLRVFRRTELFGVVGVLVSILLSEGRRAGQAGSQAPRVPKLPQTLISLAVQMVRMLNQVARIDLITLQKTLGACRQQELYHLLVCLFDYCSSRIHGSSKAPAGQLQDETELLHDTITLLGYYCLQSRENQGIMCYGEGQTLLTKVTSLPLHYFMDERGKAVLFPTILATCHGSEQNLECLRNEMNLSLLQKYLTAQLAAGDSVQGQTGRFPSALWQDALAFFSDAAPPAGSST